MQDEKFFLLLYLGQAHLATDVAVAHLGQNFRKISLIME